MTEIEVKLELTEKSYFEFIDHYKDNIIDTLDQWNIFFDSQDCILGRTGRTCRLRRIIHADNKEEWFVTSKSSGILSQGIASHKEIEGLIPKENALIMLKRPKLVFSQLPNCIQECLHDLSQVEFEPRADFRTIRRVIPWNDHHIESDESFLPNKSKFYELEIESSTPTEVKERISAELQSLNIPFQDSRISKSGRLGRVPGSHFSSYFLNFLSQL